RVMNLKPLDMSWKTTSRYWGWIPSFMALWGSFSSAWGFARWAPPGASIVSTAPAWRRRKPAIIPAVAPCAKRSRFRAGSAPAPHHVEELLVALGRAHLVEQELHGGELVHVMEELAQDPDLLEHVGLDQELLAPGARAIDVDGRVDPLFHHPAVEVKLHVAGALELFVDDFSRPTAGVDQGRGDDRERAAFLDVAGRAEEALGALQRIGVDAAGQNLARCGDYRVVGAREAGDRVEQDDDILLVLDQALGLLDDHLGDLHVARRRFVEGRGNDLAPHRALHLGDFLGALVDQQDDHEHIRVVRSDG